MGGCDYCGDIDGDCVAFGDGGEKLEGDSGEKNDGAGNGEGGKI